MQTTNPKTELYSNLFENFLKINLYEVDPEIRGRIMEKWTKFKGVFADEKNLSEL